MKNKLSFIFRIAVSLALIFALFKFVPYRELLALYARASKLYLTLAFLAILACHVLCAQRWRLLLAALDVKIPFREACYSFFSSLFFNLFFPSFLAGDIFRSVGISRRHGKIKKVASSVLMDRFSGSFALSLVATVAFGFGLITGRIRSERQIVLSLLVLTALVAGISLIIFSRTVFTFFTRILKDGSKLKTKLINFHDQLYFFRIHPKVFLQSLFFSALIQILTPISFFLTAKAFGADLGLMYFLILVPIIMAIALIPITIAGAGTREAAAVYFFALVGLSKSMSLGISLLNLAFSIISGIIGGIFYVAIYHRWIQSRS
ncbi:MAG: lysylphosphatidylglycerol synthase transmembrane domain-containing protein [Candidatus Omnitrophica bacterium]|nr:lysylphosphatidylglycerol synthase transmembrane domain-containing protein [Candidatus Omnitrophota bacterium]